MPFLSGGHLNDPGHSFIRYLIIDLFLAALDRGRHFTRILRTVSFDSIRASEQESNYTAFALHRACAVFVVGESWS